MTSLETSSPYIVSPISSLSPPPARELPPSRRFRSLSHLQTPILVPLINILSLTQTILPQFWIGLLHPKVLLVEVRLSCCPEPISRHGQPYTPDLVLWWSLRYDHSSYHLPQKNNPLRRYGTIHTRSSANCLPLQLRDWLELPFLWDRRLGPQNSAGVGAGSYIIWHMTSCEWLFYVP